MTNTPIPQSARRLIVAGAKQLQEMIEDISFQFAMDTIGDSEYTASDDDDENEKTTEEYAMRIRGQIIARIHLAYMMESAE
jgi:hypothetical protein